MDPISITIELELGGMLLAFIGGIFTALHSNHQQQLHHQRERQHKEHLDLQERHHQEHMNALLES